MIFDARGGELFKKFMISPNLVQGRLSLGSYIKIFVIGSIGMLPVLAVLFGLAWDRLVPARSGHAFARGRDIVGIIPVEGVVS